jgi:hypothetical protein
MRIYAYNVLYRYLIYTYYKVTQITREGLRNSKAAGMRTATGERSTKLAYRIILKALLLFTSNLNQVLHNIHGQVNSQFINTVPFDLFGSGVQSFPYSVLCNLSPTDSTRSYL